MPARRIGRVADAGAGFVLRAGAGDLRADPAALADAYHGAIPAIMSGSAAVIAAAEEPFTPVP